MRAQKSTTNARVRLPITVQIMRNIEQTLSESANPERLVVWAIACTAFFVFFRLGELLPVSAAAFNPTTDLAWGDVCADSLSAPTMIQIHLKRSKYDQFGIGANILVGTTGAELCPVRAILDYIAVCGTQPGAFFLNSSQRPIVKPWFVEEIRRVLSSMGLPQQQYAGHSFRIGAATTAAMVGVEDSMIQTLGRWHSSAFLRYIRTPNERLAAVSGTLANAPAFTS